MNEKKDLNPSVDAMYQPKTVIKSLTKIHAQLEHVRTMLKDTLPQTACAVLDLQVEVHRVEKMLMAEQQVFDGAEAARELEDLTTRKI